MVNYAALDYTTLLGILRDRGLPSGDRERVVSALARLCADDDDDKEWNVVLAELKAQGFVVRYQVVLAPHFEDDGQ